MASECSFRPLVGIGNNTEPSVCGTSISTGTEILAARSKKSVKPWGANTSLVVAKGYAIQRYYKVRLYQPANRRSS